MGRRLLRSLERAASLGWESIILANAAAKKVTLELAKVRRFYAAAGYELVHETTPSGTVVLIKDLAPGSAKDLAGAGGREMALVGGAS